MPRRHKWIGVDLDGTLAYLGKGRTAGIGSPIPAMADRVRKWLAEGRHVKIMTARATWGPEAIKQIQDWGEKHFQHLFEVTCIKDSDMEVLFDDRAVAVQFNTGRIVGFRMPHGGSNV